jgi:capsular polysaccharide biosynthesis protein
MEIRHYLSIIRRRLWLAVLIIAAAIAAGWAVTPRDDAYTATSTLYVGSRSINIDPGSGELSADRAAGLDRLITTFTELVRTQPIATAAVERTGVARTSGEVASSTHAKQVPETNLIRVSFTDRDARVAQSLANGVAVSLVDQIRDFEPRDTRTTRGEVISVYEQAGFPSHPNPSGLARNLVLAGLFGVIVAGAVLALLEYLDITLRSVEHAERQLELPVLGWVPSFSGRLPVAPAVNVQVNAPPPESQQRQGASVV